MQANQQASRLAGFLWHCQLWRLSGNDSSMVLHLVEPGTYVQQHIVLTLTHSLRDQRKPLKLIIAMTMHIFSGATVCMCVIRTYSNSVTVPQQNRPFLHLSDSSFPLSFFRHFRFKSEPQWSSWDYRNLAPRIQTVRLKLMVYVLQARRFLHDFPDWSHHNVNVEANTASTSSSKSLNNESRKLPREGETFCSVFFGLAICEELDIKYSVKGMHWVTGQNSLFLICLRQQFFLRSSLLSFFLSFFLSSLVGFLWEPTIHQLFWDHIKSDARRTTHVLMHGRWIKLELFVRRVYTSIERILSKLRALLFWSIFLRHSLASSHMKFNA